MGFWEVFLIGIGLAMDAFAVSVGKGLATPKYEPKGSLICGLWFGGFQMLMPLIGCFLGTQFAGYIESVDHWIAFVLLALIGGNMIRESRSGDAEDVDSSYAPMRMLPLAVATAIDALAVGVTFAFLGTDIWSAVAVIGATTFVLHRLNIWRKICVPRGTGRRRAAHSDGNAHFAEPFGCALIFYENLLSAWSEFRGNT